MQGGGGRRDVISKAFTKALSNSVQKNLRTKKSHRGEYECCVQKKKKKKKGTQWKSRGSTRRRQKLNESTKPLIISSYMCREWQEKKIYERAQKDFDELTWRHKAYNLQKNGKNGHKKKNLDNTTQRDNQLPRRTVTDTQFSQRGRKDSSLICYQLEGFATRK